jgi:hypothetical protein
MASTIDEMIETELPGWRLVGMQAAASINPARRVDAVSPSLERLKAKHADLARTSVERLGPASREADILRSATTAASADEPQPLTGSLLVERDGQVLRVDYLLDGLKIISIQG